MQPGEFEQANAIFDSIVVRLNFIELNFMLLVESRLSPTAARKKLNFSEKLINTTWDRNKELIKRSPVPPTKKTHQDIKSLVIHKMQKDENNARRRLLMEHNSESSRNLTLMDLNKTKFKVWIKKIHDRTTQRLMTTMLTDTAFRLCGDRLDCPHYPNTPLNLLHIINDCPYLQQERTNAQLYTKKFQKRENDFANTDLFINMCSASKMKVTRMLQEARAVHPAIQPQVSQQLQEQSSN